MLFFLAGVRVHSPVSLCMSQIGGSDSIVRRESSTVACLGKPVLSAIAGVQLFYRDTRHGFIYLLKKPEGSNALNNQDSNNNSPEFSSRYCYKDDQPHSD